MINDEETVHFNIYDPIGSKTGITAKWLNDGKFSVYGYKHKNTSAKDAPSSLAGASTDAQLTHLRTEFIFEHPVLRILLAESVGIFKNVQAAAAARHARGMAHRSNTGELLLLSRTYRSTVRACLEQLQDALAETDEADAERETLENYVTIFYSVECVWHLCEILLIDQHSGQHATHVVVPQLLEWTRFHFPTYERRAAELMFGGARAGDIDDERRTDEEILAVCKGLIAQGLTDVARTLLRLHSESGQRNAFRCIDEMFLSQPVYRHNAGIALPKFRVQWQCWVASAESQLAAGQLANDPELEHMVRLMCGQPAAWQQLAGETATSCWYELLAGWLHFTEPGCKHFELGTFAEVWLQRWQQRPTDEPEETELRHLDRLVLKVMENDMRQVVHDLQHMCDNKWFVTHLTDLLWHSGCLQIAGGDQQQTE